MAPKGLPRQRKISNRRAEVLPIVVAKRRVNRQSLHGMVRKFAGFDLDGQEP
jgi:hypothetical protein